MNKSCITVLMIMGILFILACVAVAKTANYIMGM